MMQARECKRQADNCALGGATAVDGDGGLGAGGASGGGGGMGGIAPHIEQMHSEWTAHRDNRLNTVQSLKDLRKAVICHERQVIQQRMRNAKDVDRIGNYMMRLEKVQTQYDELEAVVRVVFPEAGPRLD
jgi:hypothetical protein